MALGGYKFAGYRATRGDLGTVDWILKLHKARVKAFLAASDIANAGWEPDLTAGSFDFETYGNIIYSLDSENRNLVSFFKNGDSAFFAIVTVTKWASQITSGYVTIPYEMRYYSYSSSFSSQNYYNVAYAYNVAFHVVASERLTPNNIFSTDRLQVGSRLFGAGSLYFANLPNSFYTDLADLPSSSAKTAVNYYTVINCGYAVKGKNIISIYSHDETPNSTLYSAMSCEAFSSLCNAADNYPWLCFHVDSSYTTSADEFSTTVAYDGAVSPSALQFFSKPRGQIIPFYYGNSSYSTYAFPAISTSVLSAMASGNGEIPYCSIALGNVTYNAAGTGCDGKGNIDVEFIASNVITGRSKPSKGMAVSGGNYLCVYLRSYGSSDPAPFATPGTLNWGNGLSTSFCLYVGWDPSNPDITQASAWTEYAPAEETAEIEDPLIVA